MTCDICGKEIDEAYDTDDETICEECFRDLEDDENLHEEEL